MAHLDEKISAVNTLMENGILNAEELNQIVQILKERDSETHAKNPLERKYTEFMKNNVALAFKNPFSVSFPPLQRSMVKQGELSVCLDEGVVVRQFHYIETYAESLNSYGDVVKEHIAIVLDEKKNFIMVLQELKHSLMQTGLRQWIPMSGILM